MWPYPKILAHRGGGKLAPENTIAALRCGLAHGFHAVEFDVMLAADNVPVVLHDSKLGRTIAGNGDVPDFTAVELQSMDAGAWFGPDFAGEAVPAYEQVLNFCRDHRIWMNVEIKPAPGYEALTGHTVAKQTAAWLAQAETVAALAGGWQEPLFSSFSYVALQAAQEAAPTIARALLVDAIPPDWQIQLTRLAAVALHTNHKNLTPELAATVKQAAYGLFCYTVNDAARAREILSWGVDAFCTDSIDVIGADFR